MILRETDIDRNDWNWLVKASTTGTWFQSPDAYDFYASLPELFKPFAVAVENDGKLRGVCVGYVTVEQNAVKQFMMRRAIIVGGPVIADDATTEEVETLMMDVRNQFKIFDIRFMISDAPIYIETRNFNDYGKWKGAFERAGFSYKKHLNFHVACRDQETMWERLSENRKRQIRKANGLAISGLANSEDEIREWYEMLRELYRTKVKTPLWPVEFFLEAYRQGVGKFLLVRHEGKVIGGSMVVTDGKCVYEWYECGMNAVYKEHYPSVMATWAGMTLAQETGCSRYDMMGAGEPGVPYGVRDFKSEFGGELVEYGRFLCVTKPILYRLGSSVVRMLKRK